MSTAFCFIHSLSDLSNLIPLEAQNCKKHRLLLYTFYCDKSSQSCLLHVALSYLKHLLGIIFLPLVQQ